MKRLTDYSLYADAQRYFSKESLWALFDGDRERLNVTHECVDRHRGKGIVVRVAHAEGRDEVIALDELCHWSSRVAHWLVTQGVHRGERVGIMLEPSLAFYAALFGAMKSGAVAVPLFTLFGPEGLRLRICNCTPRVLVVAEDRSAVAKRAGVDLVLSADALLDAASGQPIEFESHTGANDLALLQYTSGTTRERPQAIEHRHRSVVTVAVAALYATGVRPGERFMCPSSPAWGHGLAHGTLGPLGLGVSISSYAGRFDAGRLLQALEDYAITNLSAAPTHYRMMRQCGLAERHDFQVEKLSYTGEPMDAETAAWAQRTFGRPVCSIYGTTEVGVVIAQYPGAADLPVKLGSLGKPVPGLEVVVLDAKRERCPHGVVGEVAVERRGGWFRTGDFGYTDEDGHFYQAGRVDDVIISAGWTIAPKPVEDVLLGHPAVREAAVIGVPDAVRGQVVKAFVVTDGPAHDGLDVALKERVKTRLSAHEYPRAIEFVESLPKTPAGKLNRRALREAATTARDP